MTSMKSVLFFVYLLFLSPMLAQDRITKVDGSIVTGKIISYQNERLSILQSDETEIVMPRKAIVRIEFDVEAHKTSTSYIERGPSVLKENVPKIEEKVLVPKSVEAPIKPEPQYAKAIVKGQLASPGIVSGLESRVLEYSEGFKERPVGVGIVAVEVCLNAEGAVIMAKFKAARSTTLDTDLRSIAVQNAREFKFSKGKNDECGIITYKFNVD
jgi:hypothetical protein